MGNPHTNPPRLSFLGSLLSAAVLGSGVYFYLLFAWQPDLWNSIGTLGLTLLFVVLIIFEVRQKYSDFWANLLAGLLMGVFFALQAFYPLPLAVPVILLIFWLSFRAGSLFALFALAIIYASQPDMFWIQSGTTLLALVWTQSFTTLRSSAWFFVAFFLVDLGFRAIQPDAVLILISHAALLDTLIALTSFFVGIWFFSNFFQKTFFLKLLELLNPHDKLLLELKRKAPGTYHHSLLVATIASYAAEKIPAADPLLAQVGGQLHDIGKIFHAKSFVENQYDKTVNTSRTRDHILSHVNAGLKIANRYKLPDAVKGIIATHHGNSVTGFYQTELKRAKGTNRKVKISDFRYPGPLPSTYEQTIVMLADTTEAAVRSKGKRQFSKQELSQTVDEIIADKIKTHQLDCSPLTLNELTILRDSFVDILTAIHHARVEEETNR